MKTTFLTSLISAFALLLSVNAAQAADSDTDQVQAPLKSYQRVLNASDVAGVLELYTVFEPQLADYMAHSMFVQLRLKDLNRLDNHMKKRVTNYGELW